MASRGLVGHSPAHLWVVHFKQHVRNCQAPHKGPHPACENEENEEEGQRANNDHGVEEPRHPPSPAGLLAWPPPVRAAGACASARTRREGAAAAWVAGAAASIEERAASGCACTAWQASLARSRAQKHWGLQPRASLTIEQGAAHGRHGRANERRGRHQRPVLQPQRRCCQGRDGRVQHDPVRGGGEATGEGEECGERCCQGGGLRHQWAARAVGRAASLARGGQAALCRCYQSRTSILALFSRRLGTAGGWAGACACNRGLFSSLEELRRCWERT